MNMIPEARNLIILHLMENNFLNEERFAKTYVRGKFRIKNWGRRRLTLELRKKGISKVNINLALKEIEESVYIEVFKDLSEKKAKSLCESNRSKKKKKLHDYLIYRGWEPHLVYDRVNELIK
ncbi:MAG: RecX family transcriptional regulator [Bacteroidia bacterium]|nr:RecX family transcriptional regulator [Bacteroidia bacterium]NNK27477.1 RecX family transcriptional regulator [Flavobacteriaceae bacterium]